MPEFFVDKDKRNINFDLQYGDGLQWIWMGLYNLMIIPIVTTSVPTSFALFLVLFAMLPVYNYVRRKYIIPRRGIAKVRPKSIIEVTGLGILTALIAVLGGMWATKNNYEGTPMLIWSVAIIILVGIMWTYYALNQWDGKHPYPILERIMVLLLILSLPLSNYSMVHLAIGWCIYSLFTIVMGVRQFYRFIRNNPVLDDDQ